MPLSRSSSISNTFSRCGEGFSGGMAKKKMARVADEARAQETGGRSGGEDDDGEGGGASSSKGKSLYEIIGVERTATHQEIKKAYYKLALKLHPDKNPGDEEAKEKFQLLQKVISILGDEEKRGLYDQTGYVDDDGLGGEASQNLQEFFRSVFRRVSEADIEEFEAKYRGSDSEKKDLMQLFVKFKGNMNRLFCSMLCSDPKLDSHRFKDIIDEVIAEGELKTTKVYQKWAKQISETKPPTHPLVRRRKGKESHEADLLALVAQRRDERKQRFDSVMSSITSKLAGSGRAPPPEPSDEEFEKIQQRLESSRKQKQARKRKA